jgi:hypothetical protein
MTVYWVDPAGLDQVTGSMSAVAPEQEAYESNVGAMEGARGAFSSDDDNSKFADTLSHIESQHSDIAAMYQNVLDRLIAVSKNYSSSDEAAAQRLS